MNFVIKNLNIDVRRLKKCIICKSKKNFFTFYSVIYSAIGFFNYNSSFYFVGRLVYLFVAKQEDQ